MRAVSRPPSRTLVLGQVCVRISISLCTQTGGYGSFTSVRSFETPLQLKGAEGRACQGMYRSVWS